MKKIILLVFSVLIPLLWTDRAHAEEVKYEAIFFRGETTGNELMSGVYNQDGFTYTYFPKDGFLLVRSGDGYITRYQGKLNYSDVGPTTKVNITYSEARTALTAYSTDQSSFKNTWGYEEKEVFSGAGLIREVLENLKEFFKKLTAPFFNVIERIRDVVDGIFGGVVEGFKGLGKAIADFFSYLNPTKKENLWKDLFFDAEGIKEDFLKIYESKKNLHGVIGTTATAEVFGLRLSPSVLSVGDTVLSGMLVVLLGLEAFNRIDDFMKGE